MGLYFDVTLFFFMVSHFYIKSPPKRKGTVSRHSHYVMMFPIDLQGINYCEKLIGMPYTNYENSFLEDCVDRMLKYAPELFDYNEDDIMTSCLN